MNKKNIAKATLATFTLAAALPFSALAATDTNGHWAQKNLDRWEKAKLMVGYEDGSMRPDNTITRAEFVSFVNRVAGFKADGNTKKFIDVVGNEWYATEIDASSAYLAGYPDGTFQPNANITRAEAAAIISRILNLPADPAAAEKLADAASQPEWAKGAIGAVLNAGFMKADANGNFNGEALATRAETVYALDNGYTAKVDAAIKANTTPVYGGGGSGSVKPESKTAVIGKSSDFTVTAEGVMTTVKYTGDKKIKSITLPAGTVVNTNIEDYPTVELEKDLVKYVDEAPHFNTKDLAEVIKADEETKEWLAGLNQELAQAGTMFPADGPAVLQIVSGYMETEAVVDAVNKMVVTFE